MLCLGKDCVYIQHLLGHCQLSLTTKLFWIQCLKSMEEVKTCLELLKEAKLQVSCSPLSLGSTRPEGAALVCSCSISTSVAQPREVDGFTQGEKHLHLCGSLLLVSVAQNQEGRGSQDCHLPSLQEQLVPKEC